MATSVPQIFNVKTPEEQLNARMLLSYPADTPFGNLNLAQLELIGRIDYLNTRIAELYATYARYATNIEGTVPLQAQWLRLEIEEIVYWLRKSTDSLICITSILAEFRGKGAYPVRIPVDCIGAALNRLKISPVPQTVAVFQPHANTLLAINAISNTYKHHFINFETVNVLGPAGPTAFYISMERNDAKNPATFYGILVSDLVGACNKMYRDVRGKHAEWLTAN